MATEMNRQIQTIMKLCDLHSHVIPGVDHGAQDMKTALQMLKNAIASDVEYLAVTPHFNTAEYPVSVLTKKIQFQFRALQEAAADLPIKLALGAEFHVTPDFLMQIESGRLPTINGSRYLLTEFPTFFREELFVPTLKEFLKHGYIPLIAHPERYAAVARYPEIVERWLDMGCHLQITGDSVRGALGADAKKTAAFLLRNDYVACIASDAHGVHARSNYLMGVYDHLCVNSSRQYAQCLMYDNPLRIWNDENL